jgi:hypothetical protein
MMSEGPSATEGPFDSSGTDSVVAGCCLNAWGQTARSGSVDAQSAARAAACCSRGRQPIAWSTARVGERVARR